MKPPKLGHTPLDPSDLPANPPTIADVREALRKALTVERDGSTARMVENLDLFLRDYRGDLDGMPIAKMAMCIVLVGMVRSWNKAVAEGSGEKLEDMN